MVLQEQKNDSFRKNNSLTSQNNSLQKSLKEIKEKFIGIKIGKNNKENSNKQFNSK